MESDREVYHEKEFDNSDNASLGVGQSGIDRYTDDHDRTGDEAGQCPDHKGM